MSALLLACGASKPLVVSVDGYRNVSEKEILYDSIFLRDSVVFMNIKDTVYVTRWHTHYRDRLSHDTVFIRDTLCLDRVVVDDAGKMQETTSVKKLILFLLFLFMLWKCGVFDLVSRLLKRIIK